MLKLPDVLIGIFVPVTLNTPYEVILQKNSISLNGTITEINKLDLSDGAFNIYLFTINDQGSPSANKLKGKIYYAKFYDDNTLVRDFVPVQTGCGDAAMYDKVTQQLFYNKGSGAFSTP